MKSNRSAVASRWRASRYTELTLPSGETVEVRIPSLNVFVTYGRLPASLLTKMAGFAAKGTAEDAKAVPNLVSDLSADEFGAFMLFAREIVRAALVSPCIVVKEDGDETPLKDDEVAPEDIPELDFWAIFRWATAQERGSKLIKAR